MESSTDRPAEPLDTLEKADIYAKNLSEIEQAYIYKALNFNGMNLTHADSVISKHKQKEKK